MRSVRCRNCATYSDEWCESIIDSPDPDLERDCKYYIKKTNYFNIKNMNIEKLSEYLIDIGWDCSNCSESERLDDNPLLRNEKCDCKCELHCYEWLNSEVK